MIGVRLGVGHHFSGGFDSSASAFFTATGITGATEQQAVNTLVTSLKSAGLWSKMKAVYPFVTDNTNLMGYTEDFSNAYWSKSGVTVTANDTTAPNGTLTADKIVFSGANNLLQGTYSAITSLGNCYHSIWVKGTSGETIRINDGYVAVTTLTLNGSWQQVEFYTNRGTQPQGISVDTYSGATARTIWLWGAQVSIGSSAVTYQPIATTQQSYISNQFKYNLVNPVDSDAAFRGVFNGGWTFSNNGATPNGTNGYMDTKYNPNVNGQLNSAHLSYYSRTQIVSNQVEMGTYGLASNGHYLLYNFSNTTYVSINDLEGLANTITNTTGMLIGQRFDASTLKYYLRGNLFQTITRTSTTRPNTNIVIGAYNLSNNVPSLFSTKQCAFSSIGDGLTDTEATAFYNAVQTMNSTLNRAV